MSSLDEEHIRQLGRIVETLERSTFDFLQLEVGDLKVTVGKGDLPALPISPPQTSAPGLSSIEPTPAAIPEAPAEQPTSGTAGEPPPPAPGTLEQETVEITSPIMGMFYAQPEPGAAPFVTIGAAVEKDSTVGLVEVMKTFSAVKAGVRGTIVELCVPDVRLVEFGQVLFRVAPE